MSSFILKLFSCICMFCDHFGDIFFNGTTFLNYIGRFSFTIFCFQIVQGYIHTHNVKKYIYRLLVFALISQIPYMIFYRLAFNTFGINVIFTLLFGLLVILIYDKYNKFVGFSSCLFLGVLAEVCKFDYGFYGVALIFVMYLLRNKKFALIFIFPIMAVLKYYFSILKFGVPFSYLLSGNPYSICMLFSVLSIIPVLLYNGKKGKDAKYLFYIFYPLHLLIICSLSII